MTALAVPARAAPRAAPVRPLQEEDLPGVVALHQRVFGKPRTGAADLAILLREIFCHHPWQDERMPSLVAEEDGEIVGCLGVMPRPMRLEGEPVLAAVSHNGMVAPEHRSSLVAIELVRTFLSGPQQFSFTPGNEAARRVWSALGGRAILPYSLASTVLLRPATYLYARLVRGALPGWLAAPASLPCAVADLLAVHWPASRFATRPTGLVAEDLDARKLGEALGRFASRRALHPHYEQAALEWMLRVLDRPTGEPTRRLLLRREGEVAGWYLYHPRRRGIASVLQLAAAPGAELAVLDHLLLDARRQRCAAVSGRLDPALWPAVSERPALFHRGRNATWLVAHSRDDRMLRALERGDAFFTPFEGEFWA